MIENDKATNALTIKCKSTPVTKVTGVLSYVLNFVNGAIKKTHLFAILALTSKRVEGIIVK